MNCYWIKEGEKKIYFVDNVRIGEEYDVIKHLIAKQGVSSSKAHKLVDRIKENKAKK